ncbi:MAG: hypothetical protein FJ134_09475 [Deltaproteobacteria bacterium]|nr:hypothetical protein [Deltaproteobacteria bacterium]
MKSLQEKLSFKALLAGLLAAFLVVSLAPPASAGTEDVAMFYEELSPYGQWVDYGNHGPVWVPTRVSENWRPYLDGRWVPTDDGWVFETNEPWGWATYHYGNWMPTQEHGWAWVPGRTWYPSTAAWRTSEEHIGWAPIPPPNYVPPPAYAPPGGYSPGSPILDLITAPFWIFAQAANFLLGFGQPYVPSYSYYNCGCLAPFPFIPTIFPRTVFLSDVFFPAFAPRAFFFFGPRFPFVARVTRINIVRINNFARDVTIIKIRNGLPPRFVLDRRHFIRDTIPRELREGRRLEIRRAGDVRRFERELARPDVVASPRDLPRVPKIDRELRREVRERERVRPEVRERERREFREREERRFRPEVRERERREFRERDDRFRGMRLPPQSLRGPREMRDDIRRERQFERRTLPREDLRRFRREEFQIRRQDPFRGSRVREFRQQRIERPQMERRAPEFRQQQRQTPRGGGGPQRGRGGDSGSGRGR